MVLFLRWILRISSGVNSAAMNMKSDSKNKTPTTLLQLLMLFLKNIIQSFPKRILFSLITGIVVLGIHTYLMVVQNEGFYLDPSTKILQYILLLKSGGISANNTFRLMNATFFWMLASSIFWEIVSQIRQVGFKVCFAKMLDNFVKLFSDIFQKPGTVTFSLFLGAILAGMVTGMLLGNPPVCILLSILLFIHAGARETSLLNIVLYLGWCDLQRLFRVKTKKPYYIDIVLMFIRGISIGLVLYAFTPYITNGNIVRYVMLFVVAGLMVLNIARKAKPKLASFLFLVTGAILICASRALADDGGWSEAGGTLAGWLNSSGSWEAIREGLKPALAVLSIGLGFVPILGDLKDIQEVLTGVDLITGEKLSPGERLLTAVAMLVPVVNGKMLRAGADLAVEGAGLIARHGDEAVGILKNSDELAGLAGAGNKFSDIATKSDEIADLAGAGNKFSDVASKSDEVADLAGAGNKASDITAKGDNLSELAGAGNKTSDVLKNSDEISDTVSDATRKGDGITADVGNKAADAADTGVGKAGDDFEGTLRGEKVQLPGVKTKEINYIKRDPADAEDLRKAFDRTERKKFLKDLSNNQEALKKAGLSDDDILDLEDGLVPDGWQVHHKLPLDDGGNNSLDNLVLIKNEPYHKTITNFQNSFAKKLKMGENKTVDWPIPEGSIYPPGK